MKALAMKRMLAALALIASMVPALSFFGVRDIFPLAGFDNPGRVPPLSRRTIFSRQWQSALEKSYSKTFFLRSLMYRTRCQTMEALNFGLSHESEQQSMGQFEDGALLAFPYMWTYHDPMVAVSREMTDAALGPISALGRMLASNGVDMVFVMATDKYQFSGLPAAGLAGRLFGTRLRKEFQSEYGRLLSEYGIASFDTYAFLTNEAPKHAAPMFPFAGTHWNAQASSLIVDELLDRLNKTGKRPYAINKFAGVAESADPLPMFADNDLGRLLNLLNNPYLRKNKSYMPRFACENFPPNEGSAILFGDSFSCEIASSMWLSGDFDMGRVLLCDKRIPTARELDAILPDLRLVLFVYQTPNMLSLGVNPVGNLAEKFCGILSRSFPRRRCAPEDGGGKAKTLPTGKRIRLNASHRKNKVFFLFGLSEPEKGWTWTSGKTALMRFKTKSDAATLLFNMDCAFINGGQRVIAKANGVEVFNAVCGGEGFRFEFDNPGAGEVVDLLFHFPDAVSPAADGLSDDKRTLALMIRSVTVSPVTDGTP